ARTIWDKPLINDDDEIKKEEKKIDLKKLKTNIIHLNENDLFKKMDKITEKYLLNGKEYEFGMKYLEELSTTIIERSEKLRKDGNVSMKQRALVDLLQELKEIGISHLLKPLQNISTIQNIFEQERIEFNDNHSEIQKMFEKTNYYFY